MRIRIADDLAELAHVGADLVVAALMTRPHPVLGVATGSSPLALYTELARRVAAGTLSVAHVRAFALDEYIGLPLGHPESYREVVRRTVTSPLGLAADAVRVPDGAAEDLLGAAASYETAIQDAGGVDVQVLGIGRDGHIGFNEPGSSFASRTRPVALTPDTVEANARFFDSVADVPRFAVTQGIGTILQARRIVLMASGSQKADAVASCVEGALSAAVPASALQLHPDVTLLLDTAAAASLRHADYYRLADLVPASGYSGS